jgi:hypothetical protein
LDSEQDVYQRHQYLLLLLTFHRPVRVLFALVVFVEAAAASTTAEATKEASQRQNDKSHKDGI